MFFFLGLYSHQSLVEVSLQFCNYSQTCFIDSEALHPPLPSDDFPRLGEPLGILSLDTALQLLRFLLQWFCCLLIFWLLVWRSVGFKGSSSEPPFAIAACNEIAESWQWRSYGRLPSEWNFLNKMSCISRPLPLTSSAWDFLFPAIHCTGFHVQSLMKRLHQVWNI